MRSGHGIAMLMNAWAKKKSGGAFTAADIFPGIGPASGQANRASADDPDAAMAFFQNLARQEQRMTQAQTSRPEDNGGGPA